eukprot:gene21523-28510_t
MELLYQLLDANTSKAESKAELLELTGPLVGVKKDLAEKDSLYLMVQQRLMRALNAESRSKEEIEELRRKIAVLSPEEAGAFMDDCYQNSVAALMAVSALDRESLSCGSNL